MKNNLSIWVFGMALLMTMTVSSCIVDINSDDDEFPFNDCIDAAGSVNTYNLNIADFRGFNLKIPADVYVSYGSSVSVEVEAQANVFAHLDNDVRGGIWDIEYDRCLDDVRTMNIYITMPEVEYIAIDGVGNVYSNGTLDADNLDLRIQGAGDMFVDVIADEIDVRISGVGDLELGGSTEFLNCTISGAGSLDAFDMTTQVAEIDILGVGNAEVYVEDFLKVFISGAGNVFYRGNPTIDQNIIGVGKVIDRN